MLLTGCFTGQRPTLIVDSTVPPVSDVLAQNVIAILEITPSASFTVSYEIVTKYGDIHTAASMAFDPALGVSITIAEVRYIYAADGTTQTCSTITGACTPGIDESRVSDRQLVSTIFKSSAIERIRQDTRVAVGSAVASVSTIVENQTSCIAIPVVDANGAAQSKTYCVFIDLGVIASLDAADIAITALSVVMSAAPEQFSA